MSATPKSPAAQPGAAAAPGALSGRTRSLILVAVALIYMATNADGPSFNLSIPTIQEQFGGSYFATQILTNAAQLCVAALVLAAGTLGDLYGRRKWLLIGATGMFLGYVLQFFATGMPMMIGARLLVGFSTALTTALTLAVVNVYYSGAAQAQAIGIFLGLASLSAAVTPIVSQWLNQSFGWRYSFVLPMIICACGLLLVWRFVPESRSAQTRKLDVVGLVLNAAGLAAIVYGCILAGTEGWTSMATLIWLAIGVVAFALFLWWERRTPDPALKLSLFKNPVFALAVFTALALNLVDFGIQPSFSTFLQSLQGRSAFATSIILLPWALGAAIAAPIAGRLARRISPRKLIAGGLLLGCVSLLVSLLLKPTSSPWLVVLLITPWALAYGIVNIPRSSVLMASVSKDDSGAASGANSMGAETGSALGLAVFGTLIATFASNNYHGRLANAGLSPDKISEAVKVLTSAIEGTLQQFYPRIDPAIVSQLAKGFELSYTFAVTATLIVSAILILANALMVWIGMRGRADEPLTDVAVGD